MSLSIVKMKGTDIQKALKKLPAWNANTKQTEIAKTFRFTSFVEGLAFIAKIAVHAEVMGHHPDIEFSYGKVKVRLSTHSVKGLSKLDFELAEKIERVAKC